MLERDLQHALLGKTPSAITALYPQTAVHFHLPQKTLARTCSDSGCVWAKPIFYRPPEQNIVGGSRRCEICLYRRSNGYRGESRVYFDVSEEKQSSKDEEPKERCETAKPYLSTFEQERSQALPRPVSLKPKHVTKEAAHCFNRTSALKKQAMQSANLSKWMKTCILLVWHWRMVRCNVSDFTYYPNKEKSKRIASANPRPTNKEQNIFRTWSWRWLQTVVEFLLGVEYLHRSAHVERLLGRHVKELRRHGEERRKPCSPMLCPLATSMKTWGSWTKIARTAPKVFSSGPYRGAVESYLILWWKNICITSPPKVRASVLRAARGIYTSWSTQNCQDPASEVNELVTKSNLKELNGNILLPSGTEMISRSRNNGSRMDLFALCLNGKNGRY